ncbi:hypothetical protein O9993_02800 [Vibrio lentus]|nr:hypothetical protein [Vibrio lentus]
MVGICDITITNGAAGVIPAVLMYYIASSKELDTKQLKRLFSGIWRYWHLIQNQRFNFWCRSGLSRRSWRIFFNGAWLANRPRWQQRANLYCS